MPDDGRKCFIRLQSLVGLKAARHQALCNGVNMSCIRSLLTAAPASGPFWSLSGITATPTLQESDQRDGHPAA